ncbi:hypothetical protein ACFL4B_00420 [Candidatus Neomarinimicrobiota bacterium]
MLKTILMIGLSLLLIGGIFLGCSDQMTPTGVDQTVNTNNKESLSKVDIYPDRETIIVGGLLDCNPALEMFGMVEVFWTEKELPNGNIIFKQWTDYDYYPDDMLKVYDHDNEEWYYFVKGNNPVHGTASESMDNGAWSYTEHYATDDGKKLILHQNGSWHWIEGHFYFEMVNDFCR